MNAKIATLPVPRHDSPFPEAANFTAIVEAADGEDFALRGAGDFAERRSHTPARRAASCLLRPEPGDLVLCARAASTHWILAVLARESQAACTLETPGPATLAAPGALTLQSAALNLQASESATLRTPRFEAALDTAQVAGRELHVFAGTMKLVGSALSSVMDRIQQFSRQYLRHTEALDRVSAAQVQVEAEQLLQLHGRHVLMEGENLVKARGAQIHFG